MKTVKVIILILLFTIVSFNHVEVFASKPYYNSQSHLKKKNKRSDYSSDELYANYRKIEVGNIKPNILFRGTSPYDYEFSRYKYINKFLKRDKINTIVNLDRKEIKGNIIKERSPYYYSLWKRKKVRQFSCRLKLGNKKFKKNIRNSLIYMSQNEGPYYIHCYAGKDRTGYLCALIECFMGASYNEVVNDYMISYQERFGKLSKAKQRKIKKETIDQILMEITSSNKPQTKNLQKEARRFMKSIGLNEKIQNNLYKKLSKDF